MTTELETELAELKQKNEKLLLQQKEALTNKKNDVSYRKELETKRQEQDGEYKALYEQSKADSAEVQKELSAIKSQIDIQTRNSSVLELVKAHTVGHNVAILSDIISRETETVEGVVLGKDGKSLEDLVSQYVKDDKYASLLTKAPTAAPVQEGKISREQFDNLPHEEQAKQAHLVSTGVTETPAVEKAEIKSMERSVFDAMDHQAQADHINSGGEVT